MSITRNPNFTNFTKKLDELKVKNNEFVLDVLDERVLDIDPWSESLTLAEEMIVKNEAKNNLWYFLSEIVKIQSIGNHDPIPFNINLANAKALYLAERDFNVYLSSQRQSYGTISFCAYILWKCLQEDPHYKFRYSIFVMDGQTLTFMFDRMENLIKLPKYINYIKSTARMTFIDCREIVNQIANNCAVPNIDFIFIDDFEYFRYNNINTINKIVDARNKGIIETRFIFKSSVGKKGYPGRRAADIIAMTGERFRNELFDAEELVHSNKMFYINESYKDIFDNPEEWYDEMCRVFNMDEEAIRHEVLCTRIDDCVVKLPSWREKDGK